MSWINLVYIVFSLAGIFRESYSITNSNGNIFNLAMLIFFCFMLANSFLAYLRGGAKS